MMSAVLLYLLHFTLSLVSCLCVSHPSHRPRDATSDHAMEVPMDPT
jgi:hypothetical protein